MMMVLLMSMRHRGGTTSMLSLNRVNSLSSSEPTLNIFFCVVRDYLI